MASTFEILERAKKVSALASLSTDVKNNALKAMAEALVQNADIILDANKIDVENARGNISDTMIDRLLLTKERISAMAKGILDVAVLPDYVGKVLSSVTHENGIVINKTSVPFGVVAIIYESRPNVTSDAAALCFKSGNVCVLRGGKEAYNSSFAIVKILRNALKACGLSEDYINLIEDTTRQSANELMTADGFVDLLIPRGGKGLIKACTENATVPCIETGTGICHIYADEYADIDKAIKIIINAKTSRPSVCNAAEVLLVNRKIAKELLEKLETELSSKVEFRASADALEFISGKLASDTDFDTVFLD